MTRKRYSVDFKKQIIELYISGKTALDIERDYDLHRSVIYSWIKQYNNSGLLRQLIIEPLKKIALLGLKKKIVSLR